MIFVAVGTQKFQLDRLLRQIDDLVASGAIDEPVFAQIGHSTYRPAHYDFKEFLSVEEYNQKIAQCNLLVTHSGVGTIMSGLNGGKPVVVFPRLAEFGEHVDDHQMEIAKSFEELNYVALCGKNDSLRSVIECARKHVFSEYQSQRQNMLAAIREFLDTL